MMRRTLSATTLLAAILGVNCGHASTSPPALDPASSARTSATKPALAVTIPPGPDSTGWWTTTSTTITSVGTVTALPADLLFAFDSADLSGEAEGALKGLLQQAVAHLAAPIQIDGFTDSDGAPDYNQRLSERRAESVAQWLMTHGIDGSRIRTQGWGDRRPVASNDSAAGKALNRRVEFTITTTR